MSAVKDDGSARTIKNMGLERGGAANLTSVVGQ